MLKNYFKIAWRSLLKNRVSSLVNIGGLAVGMAVAMLTGLWLHDELSFNKYHENYDRIARVAISGAAPQGPFISPTMSYPLANELVTNYRDRFKRLVRISWSGESILSAGDKRISRKGQYMDEEAPDMFTLKMIRGTRAGLHELYSILLSASTARTLFGGTDPVGRVIRINNETSVKVTGVYEDLPLNTELNHVKFIAPFALWLKQNDWIERTAANQWWNHFFKLFVEIKPGTSFEAIDRQIANVEIDHIKGFNDENHRGELSVNPKIILEPMSDWHLRGFDRRGNPDTSVKRMIWMVSLIGAFVLLLACINFMNLSTARSEKRAHEVGIRKAIGSRRKQLILQFFCESLAIVALSFLIALVLTAVSLNWFNQLAAKQMHIPWGSPFFWMVSIV
ncbi:MAG TPA: ABC transporter permease, partial [Puia sp.]|nr:ABC transporter permease [Puia sp.]